MVLITRNSLNGNKPLVCMVYKVSIIYIYHCKKIGGWFNQINVISVAVWIQPGPGNGPSLFVNTSPVGSRFYQNVKHVCVKKGRNFGYIQIVLDNAPSGQYSCASKSSLSPGHSQILSRSHVEKSGEGLGTFLRHGPEMVDLVITNQVHIMYWLNPPFPAHDIAMIPGLLPIFLHGCEIKSVSGLGTRLGQKWVLFSKTVILTLPSLIPQALLGRRLDTASNSILFRANCSIQHSIK